MRACLILLALAVAVGPARGEWMPVRAPIPLRGDGTSWTVQATVNGRTRALFLLDTGASYCVIAPALARALALPPTGSFATVLTANGAVRAPVVRLRSLDLEGTRALDIQAIVHDAVGPQIDGVLGLNFLNRYRYAVDPQRRLLELE
jgi:clan AA aspartic protease (TIGR02281 family)